MRSRRPDPAAAGRGSRSDVAARRLALLAADLGATPPAETPTPAEGDWWTDHTRVAPARRAGSEDEEPRPAGLPGSPPELPRPGRHAARRRTRSLVAVLPGLGPAQLTVVAVLVAVGLAVTAWWVVRGRAEPVSASAAPATVEPLVATATGSAPAGEASDTAGGDTVTVDVTGKVRRPGIVVLDTGARVVDALEAAGGVRPGVDLTGLNLARVLVDGEQIVVGAPAAPVPAPGTDGSPPPSGPAALVNLNLATVAELETLPEVGPVTAAAIVAWREEHGGFTSVDELLEVDGIGEVTLQQIAPYVTV